MGLDLQVYQGCIHNNVGVAHSVLVQETYADNEIDVSTTKSMRSSNLSKDLRQCTKLLFTFKAAYQVVLQTTKKIKTTPLQNKAIDMK